MFELSRGPQDQERTVRDFARDVETYLAGTVARPQADTASVTPLIERAWVLSQSRYGREDWLWWGSSGMPMTGEQIAAHAEAAIEVLRTAGWNPSRAAGRGIRDALVYAEKADPGQRFSRDTRSTLAEVMEFLIRAVTGAPHAYYESWDEHPGRVVEEVLTLLAAAAAFARRYGHSEEPATA